MLSSSLFQLTFRYETTETTYNTDLLYRTHGVQNIKFVKGKQKANNSSLILVPIIESVSHSSLFSIRTTGSATQSALFY